MGNCHKIIAKGIDSLSALHLPSCLPSPPGGSACSKQSRGTFMSRRMIWAEDERLTGWCCSHCSWGLIAPRLESTLAALAFNRVAQESFEKHACAHSSES
jgi:hypothetical protein